MKLRYYPFTIELKEQFTIAVNSRRTTPAILLELEQDDLTGYGEASLPPYLPENQQSVIRFLDKVKLGSSDSQADINNILDYIDDLDEGNRSAKAALDIALHDIFCKAMNMPVSQYLKIVPDKIIYSSFTIGIDQPEHIKKKLETAEDYKILKIKLGTRKDREIITTIREFTDKPLYIDVNQGWNDKHSALEMINWLSDQNVILIEQPLPKSNLDDTKWLSDRSSLPIIADEAVQSLDDLEIIKTAYSGINVKLMKTGGIRNAYKMIKCAKESGLKVMIGCMTETTCAISAAAHLAQLADWVDLDGAELINNDPFTGMKLIDGQVIVPDGPGLGIEKFGF